MRRAGLLPPKRPTSILPNFATPPRTAWQGLGVPAGDQALHKMLGIVVPAPPEFCGQNAQAVRTPSSKLGVTGEPPALCRQQCDPIPLGRSRMGLPSRRTKDTSVAAQHRASPRAAAPSMTKSSRRRSSAATLGAVVFASHCCGATRPSGPIASRTTWIHARSSTKPRRASSPACHGMVPKVVDEGAAAWRAVSATPCSFDGQRQTHAAPERKMHQIRRKRRGRVSRDGQPPAIRWWLDCIGACCAPSMARPSSVMSCRGARD